MFGYWLSWGVFWGIMGLLMFVGGHLKNSDSIAALGFLTLFICLVFVISLTVAGWLGGV